MELRLRAESQKWRSRGKRAEVEAKSIGFHVSVVGISEVIVSGWRDQPYLRNWCPGFPEVSSEIPRLLDVKQNESKPSEQKATSGNREKRKTVCTVSNSLVKCSLR